MAATAYYQTRERAFNRTNRIHRDINRASAYILDTDGPSLGSSFAGRSTSLTRDAPRYVDPSNTGYRFKDKFSSESFRRPTSNIPIQTTSASQHVLSNPSVSPRAGGSPKAYPKDFNPYSETARYKREQEMKDIHDEFMKSWNTQQSKFNGTEEKKSKAYHKIMGTSVSALEDRDFTRQTIGDIFKDMSKFSTKTVAALSTLDTAGTNKNKNYNWRKEIEKYETTGQLERDARIRNIEIRSKRTTSELEPLTRSHRRNESAPPPVERNNALKRETSPTSKVKPHSNISRIAQETKIEIPQEVQAQKEVKKSSRLPVIAQEPREEKQEEAPIEEPREENNPSVQSISNTVKEEKDAPVKKRTKVVKKKVTKTTPDSEIKIPAEEKEDEPVSSTPQVSNEPSKTQEDEDEDVHGTKKMKDDFSDRMASLDAEMTAGRSNLARIRERIRKAKQGLMAVEI